MGLIIMVFLLCLGAIATQMVRSSTLAATAIGGVARQRVVLMSGIGTSSTMVLTSNVATTIGVSGFQFAVSGIDLFDYLSGLGSPQQIFF